MRLGRGVALTRARERGRDGRLAALGAGGDGDGEARGQLTGLARTGRRVTRLGDGVGLVRKARGAERLVHGCVDVDSGLGALGHARRCRLAQRHCDGR